HLAVEHADLFARAQTGKIVERRFIRGAVVDHHDFERTIRSPLEDAVDTSLEHRAIVLARNEDRNERLALHAITGAVVAGKFGDRNQFAGLATPELPGYYRTRY